MIALPGGRGAGGARGTPVTMTAEVVTADEDGGELEPVSVPPPLLPLPVSLPAASSGGAAHSVIVAAPSSVLTPSALTPLELSLLRASLGHAALAQLGLGGGEEGGQSPGARRPPVSARRHLSSSL
jgi:hypothetical protein